jgi:hypothetical protein
VLQRLTQLCAAAPEAVQLRDWKALKDLPSRSAADVQTLFYPDGPADVLDDADDAGPHRAKGFLAALTPAQYHAAYRFVLAHPEQAFPDIEAALNRGRKEGVIISQVISHAVRWVNPEPTAVGHRENNKPPHWQDFVSALGPLPRAEAETMAQQLQRDIFDVVRGRWDELDGSLDGDMNLPTYIERFSSPIWHDLLVLVHRVVGPRFHGRLALYNTDLPSNQPGQPASTLTRELSKAMSQMPEVRGNPALHTPDAVKELVQRILPTVAAWALEQCNDAITARDLGTMEAWSPSVTQHVHARRLVFQEMVQGLPQPSSSQPSPSAKPTGEAGMECSPEPSQINARLINTNFRAVNTPTNPRGSDPVLQSFGLNDITSRRRAYRQAVPDQHAKPRIPGTQWARPVTTVDRIHESRINLPSKPLGEPAWMSRRPARANRG